MHPYATDSNERERITFGLAAVSVGLAWALARSLLAAHLPLPWWLDAPSTMGIFGALYAVFERSLWRLSCVHRIGLVKVPILAGGWRGRLRSSFDQHAQEREVSVEIKQSWTKLSLILESSGSTSQTVAASLLVDAPGGMILSYQYRNEPKPTAVGTMQIHYGTARLAVRGATVLDGDYYSGRGRQSYGGIHLEKVRE
jgi:hypothetical protein